MIKKYIFPVIVLFGLLSAGIVPANAQPEKTPAGEPAEETCKPASPRPAPHKKISKRELQMLKALFLMSDKELSHMRELITKLERMPEEKRRKMAEDLDRATSGNPAAQQKVIDEMRHNFERRQNNLLERYYATLPKDRAKAEAEAFLKMSRREKFEYMISVREKLGLPPRKNGDRKNEPPPQP